MSQNAICIRDLEVAAQDRLEKMVLEYFRDGAEDGLAHKGNAEAYDSYKIRQRVLRDVSRVNSRTSQLGKSIPFPLAIAPSGMQCMAHPDGEEATSRAAARAGVNMGVSTFSTKSLENIISAGESIREQCNISDGGAYMLQVYVFRDKKTTEQLIRRAEKAGYKAILLTCDTPKLGNRYNFTRNNFKLPSHLSLPNFEDQNVTPLIQHVVGDETQGHQQEEKANENDDSITWENTLPWIRSLTKMEIWLKGITTAEDVKLALESPAQISGILVSNHGGRQIESALATLDSLPECVEAARDPQTGQKRCQVWLDGGIKKGSDIFKAISLGADGVFIGRIPLWGLAVDGEKGVSKALNILKAEFQHTMALAGCKSLADINTSYLARVTNGIPCRL